MSRQASPSGICARCGNVLGTRDRACASCGAPTPASGKRFCTSCGREIPMAVGYCPFCGAHVGFAGTPAQASSAPAPPPPPRLVGGWNPRTMLIVGVVLGGLFLLAVAMGETDAEPGPPPANAAAGTPRASSAAPPASTTAALASAPWTPSAFSGSGPQETPDFFVGARQWQACFEMTSYAYLSDGRAIGVLYVTVIDGANGRSVGRLAGDAEAGNTRGCTVVRAGPGDYYFDVNAGGSTGWRVEARP